MDSQVLEAIQLTCESISFNAQRVGNDLCIYATTLRLPSTIFRPKLYIDGNKWCALYGENVQDGVCGFGDSPAEAMEFFDKAWSERLKGAFCPKCQLYSNAPDLLLAAENHLNNPCEESVNALETIIKIVRGPK